MLFIPGREQRPIKHWRTGTPGFAPVQIHAIALTIHDVDPSEMRLGGPSAPQPRGQRLIGFKLRHDGHGIGMAFEQFDQGQIACGHGSQRPPSLQRQALAGHRQGGEPAVDEFLHHLWQRSVR
ncbi:hypothetical protein D3C84_816910 [compost metagenome]